ncbi:hypothetical protein E4T56_gene10387 [Termitomyces sp. T112]|nr:hypothetical protein E4T56_gene10387 [Termitomyces sp. T112]
MKRHDTIIASLCLCTGCSLQFYKITTNLITGDGIKLLRDEDATSTMMLELGMMHLLISMTWTASSRPYF